MIYLEVLMLEICIKSIYGVLIQKVLFTEKKVAYRWIVTMIACVIGFILDAILITSMSVLTSGTSDNTISVISYGKKYAILTSCMYLGSLQVIIAFVIGIVKRLQVHKGIEALSIITLLFPVIQILFVQLTVVSPEYDNSALVSICKSLEFIADALLLYIVFLLRNRKEQQKELLEKEYMYDLEKHHAEISHENEAHMNQLMQHFQDELNTIYELYEKEGNSGQSESLLQNLQDDVANTRNCRFCGNIIVNEVLEEKSLVCENNHITTMFEVEIGEDVSISRLHLCSIFTNLLDNAIHACEGLPEDHRQIEVLCKYKGKYLNIKVSNTYDPAAEKKIQKGHGYGKKIIQEIADSYEGNVVDDAKGNWYSVMVSLKVE